MHVCVFVSVDSGTLGRPAISPFQLVVSDRVKNAYHICALSSGRGYAAVLHSTTFHTDEKLWDAFLSQVAPHAIRITTCTVGHKTDFALFPPTILLPVVESSNRASISSTIPNYPTGTVIVSTEFQLGFNRLTPQEKQIVLMHLFRSPIAVKSDDGLDLLYHAALFAQVKCFPAFSSAGLMIQPEFGKGYGVYLNARKPFSFELGIAGKVIQRTDFKKLSGVHAARVIQTCRCSDRDKCSHFMVLVDSACLPSHINSSVDSSNSQTINVRINSAGPDGTITRDESGRLVVANCTSICSQSKAVVIICMSFV